ncbi:hypothetical protein QBC35DRAFT_452305 [Podospora australis]|uniref:Uncharacterized protein n=1 Tax=Podospora australis TaxID=1536484 RepID=A0AAN6WSP4_9PEZI|nr:hypothetical protein QBC35DRAFT_452305 [Podospora australis]
MSQPIWPEPNRKRGREEEYTDISSGGTLGFTEHRSKRIQALPLRTSPNSKRWGEPPRFAVQTSQYPALHPPPTITPVSSDTEEPIIIEHCGWAEEPELCSQMNDCDTDMMDTSESAQEQNVHARQDQQFLHPAPFQTEPTAPSISGRIPTPIHCSFPGNHMHGGINALATTPEEPTAMAFDSNGMAHASYHHQSNMLGHDTVLRCLDGSASAVQAMADWSMVQNRRLPSPISESGGEDSPQMMLDSSSQHIAGQFDRLRHEHPLVANLQTRANTMGDFGQHGQEGGAQGPESPNTNGMEVESAGTPSPKRGHTRSRHTVNSWTAVQPGMKRTFSIGYRADCEKCRMKVPGHFNHIIIS